MILVDLGCKSYETCDVTTYDLYKRLGFNADVIFAFDPLTVDGIDYFDLDDPPIIRSARAAWTHDGYVQFTEDGPRSHAGEGDQLIPCFDLSAWLRTLPAPIVVKMDVEGAEYPLIEKLHADGVDAHIDRLLVELHTDWWAHGREGELPPLRCEVERLG